MADEGMIPTLISTSTAQHPLMAKQQEKSWLNLCHTRLRDMDDPSTVGTAGLKGATMQASQAAIIYKEGKRDSKHQQESRQPKTASPISLRIKKQADTQKSISLKFKHLIKVTLSITIGMAATGCQFILSQPAKDILRTESDGQHSWRTYEHTSLMTGHQLGWINNDTVLVVGDRKPEGRGIYAWNPGSKPRMMLKYGYRFCFDGRKWTALAGIPKKSGSGFEYIRYQINPKSLETTLLETKPQKTDLYTDSYFTCTEERFPDFLKSRGREILRPTDGFLDFGPHGSMNQPVTLIKADKRTRVHTNIRLRSPLSTVVEHSSYSQAYLIYSLSFNPDIVNHWKESNQHIIWQMRPDGSTKTITIPAGPWLDTGGGDKSFAISKPGLLISSNGYGETHQKQAGVFLIRENQSHSKISSGSSERLSVSPNGCRAAWSIDRPKASGIGHTSNLSAADLCKIAEETSH
jgi:hypothetical protein